MRIGSLFVCSVLVAGLFLAAGVSKAQAQSDQGEIDLLVVDVAGNVPVGNARTFLLGAQTANALTTASGSIRFTDVPVGIYRIRVGARGFDGATTREFDVLPDRAVHVRILLSKRATTGSNTPSAAASGTNGGKTLQTIGVVVARSRVSITTTDIDVNSPMRRLSDSLTDALDKLAGVSVTTDSTDPTSAIQVSLHNQDESQTALTLDGIPLSGPGSAGNLRSIGTDLFSGSQVSFSPSAGGLAGGVNFNTLQPTQALQVRASGSTGTFDRSNYLLATTGSVNKIGFVVEHTWRGSNSPLTFQDYLDQSGLTYAHGGESTSLSDLVKIRYAFGDERTSFTATALDTNRDASAICAQDVALLPCGIGPGNGTFGRYGMAYGTLQSLVGNIQMNLAAYANSSTTTSDDLQRFVVEPSTSDPSDPSNFVPTLDPSLTFESTLTRGIAYSASIAQGNHTISLSGNTYASIAASDPIVGSNFAIPFQNAASSTTYQLRDAIKSNDKVTLTPSFSFADTTGIGGSVLAGLSVSWTPKTADAFSLSANLGSSQPNLSATRSFSDPLSGRFDCQAQTAVVSGPGDTGNGQRQSATALSAAWSHDFRGGANVSIDAFSQVQSGQLITALIDEPASFYTSAGPGYLAALYSAYRSPSICGTNAPPPTVYAQESVAGTSRAYRGFDVRGRFALSPYIEVLPTYSLNVAELTAAGPRLQDGPSTTIVGGQLPNRPLHRAGITVDGLLPRSGIELLANAQYTGSNNQQHLGPYTNVSFGASHRLGPGQLTLFENNALNTYAGEFATDAYAQPVPLSNGGFLQTAATPLTPRTIFLSYALVVGGPAPGPAFRRFTRGASPVAEASPQPQASDARRPRRFASNPPPPGVDPLSLATARDSCDADAQTAAKPVYDALRSYVSAYARGSKLPTVPNMTIVPHPTRVDPSVPYYLELRLALPRPPGAGSGRGQRGGFGTTGGFGAPSAGGPPTNGGGDVVAQSAPENAPSADTASARRAFLASPAVKAFRGFIGCAYVTILTTDDARAKGIVVAGGRPTLLYVPSIGLAYVQPPELPQGGGSVRPAAGASPVPSPVVSPAPRSP